MHRRRGRQPDPSGVRRAGLTASAAARMHERARPRTAAGGLIRARPGAPARPRYRRLPRWRPGGGLAGPPAAPRPPAGILPVRRARRLPFSIRPEGRAAGSRRRTWPRGHAGEVRDGRARPTRHGASGRHVCGVPFACTHGEMQATAGRRADIAAVALGLAALGKGGRRDQRRSLLLRDSGPRHPCARTEKQPEDSTTEAIRQTACPRSRRQRRPRATRPARTRAPLRRVPPRCPAGSRARKSTMHEYGSASTGNGNRNDNDNDNRRKSHGAGIATARLRRPSRAVRGNSHAWAPQRPAMNASIWSALRSSAPVSTRWPSAVISTSSSMRMPMPRQRGATLVSSGDT